MKTPLAVLAILAVTGGHAAAGGLARPNPISARGIGMGGAFVAVADDPTALHFNPAGIALLPRSMVLVGGEFVVAPRTYTPTAVPGFVPDCADDPTYPACQPQSPSAPIRPLPVIGWVSRLTDEGVPSRMSFGVGLWNSFGGQLEYDPFTDETGVREEIPALNETRNAVIEIVPGIAYEVNDILAIGVAFRLGFGLFDAKTNSKPSTADLSATGLGAGATFGLMVRPSDTFQIGGVYRTSLTNDLSGNGTIKTGVGPSAPVLDVAVQLEQRWPQEAGVGFQWHPNPKLRLMAEFDWSNWSRLNTLEVTFPGTEDLNQTFILDWNDSWSLHAGVEFSPTKTVALRAGYTYDTAAVPDHTIERQFLDSNKMLAAVGGSWQLADDWSIETAFESTIPAGARKIENNCPELCGVSNGINVSPLTQANAGPGEHEGSLYTFELAVQYLY